MRVTVMAIATALVIGALAVVSVIFYQRSSGTGKDRAAQLRTASSSCRAFWAKGRPHGFPAADIPTTLPPFLLGDVGENNAALLFRDSQNSMVCFLRSPSSVVGVSTAGSSSTPSAAHPVTLSSPALYSGVNARFQLVTGQALGGVTSITLTLSDGTVVHPALRHGYFIAWWPGMASVTSSTFVVDGSVQHSGGAPSSPFQHPKSPFEH